jgi:formate C-acetyltransferase
MAEIQTQNLTERVRRLRQQSLDALESISSERAELLTDFYQQTMGILSVPVQRAMSFAYLLEHKRIAIYDGELIVGEKSDSPKAAPSFPELCCHTLEDLDILNTRPLTSFKVSAETRKAYQEKVIPFWQGKSIRDLLFTEMTPEWKDAYDAGIFTEFMEQRAPGHTVLDDKIYQHGMLDFQLKIDASLAKLDFLNDLEAYDKQEELKAMRITARALICFAERYSALARELALKETDPTRKIELEKIAEVCTHIPAHAPRDLHEALQYYWFVHLGVTTELNTWDSYCPGRLDQHLLPFYERGMAEGILTKEFAKELLCCFWIKFNNQPAPPKVGVTAAESGTYTDFAQINVGGLRPDGYDGVNEVSYLLLDVIEEMRLLQPSSSIQVSKKNPDRFIKRAAKIIRTGFGQPSIFNADLITQELMRAGKSLMDARCGGSSGCVEVGAFGKENYNLTGYFNLPKVLELTLHNGFDPRTAKQLGPQTGDATKFINFDQLYRAFETQLLHFVDIKVRGNQVIERLYANFMPAPFLSLLTDDCITTGKDYHNGGARYNTSYIQGVGIGSITDALSAIKTHVFGQKSFSMDEMLKLLDTNFDDAERSRQLLLNRTPKYGNDDDAADALMVRVFESYFNAVDGRRNTKGGEYHINMLPTTCHIYFGSVTGATPDGRFAGKPLSEGVSPVQGADQHGPTAVVR